MRVTAVPAVLFLASLFVGCTQGPSPTMASGVTAPTSTEAAPPAYDASGTWSLHFVITAPDTGEVLLSGDEIDTFTQDPDGTLHSENEEEGGETTLTRIGNGRGRKINYRVHSTEPSSTGCGEDLSGTAQLDTVSQTFEGRLVGVLEGCENPPQVVITITGTKIG